MIKILEQKKLDEILYTCCEGDSIESIASKFGTSVQEIRQCNPLLTNIYAGCMILLKNLGKKRVTVEPLQTLEMIADTHNTTVSKLMKLNDLKSERVFVGMQLLVEDE